MNVTVHIHQVPNFKNKWSLTFSPCMLL